MAVDHAKIRKQFGQFIGQFQAIQHKLANCLISLDGARMALETAAAARDGGNPDWRTFASSAHRVRGPGAAHRIDRVAPGARRHRLCRGARGAAPLPPRACRPRPLRRRAARTSRACRIPARSRLTDRPSRPRHGSRRKRLPQGGARLARPELDAGKARGTPEQAVQGPRLGRRVLQADGPRRLDRRRDGRRNSADGRAARPNRSYS